jgi:hypothetical protein
VITVVQQLTFLDVLQKKEAFGVRDTVEVVVKVENIRDRGMKKRTGLMLSEHVRELHIWKDKDHYEERPELDNFDLQSIQNDLEVAYK